VVRAILTGLERESRETDGSGVNGSASELPRGSCLSSRRKADPTTLPANKHGGESLGILLHPIEILLDRGWGPREGQPDM